VRTAELITFGGGHTDSDAFLFLPADRIVFAGDLVSVKNHPGLSSSHTQIWLDILAKIKSLAPIWIVPGHGEPGTVGDVVLIERYLNETMQMVEKNLSEGGTAENVIALTPPLFTEGWGNADGFAGNLKSLHVRMQSQ
jgi:glyoxylase-like metal-dependent hydrolase (beta-lactamase superfamily II)